MDLDAGTRPFLYLCMLLIVKSNRELVVGRAYRVDYIDFVLRNTKQEATNVSIVVRREADREEWLEWAIRRNVKFRHEMASLLDERTRYYAVDADVEGL